MKIERQLQGTLNTIFTELIKEQGLEGKIEPYSPQEENRADITLKKRNGKPIFFIELKDPTAKDGKSVFDSGVLLREVQRAQNLDIKYFGNCNFLACAFFDKDKLSEKVSVHEGFFTPNDIFRLSQNYSPGKDILTRLRTIAQFYIDRAVEIIERKPIKFSNLDELFIFKIRKLIEVYAYPISNKVWERYKTDKTFERQIQKYTHTQLWNKPSTYEEIENLTYIGVLMLISKLIFYKSYVDNRSWSDLYPMEIPESVSTPDDLEQLIWRYFTTFKEVTGNFELLIGERSDIIFNIPFVSDASIDLVKEVLDTEGHYDFSNIPFDIIGRIFEELIREDERHKLGQYFTPPHVIDLINAFSIHKSSDKVFDPSCGSGTFLVRAYQRKKLLCAEEDRGARHEILLNEIYGNDISGYPAYLSMLNLAIRNTHKPSYPRIANKDFFAITENSKISFHNQQGEKENRFLPKFDAIIGNPPYTRQEDIGTMHGTVGKDKIQSLIKAECGFTPSKRTSIYAYFFYHASVFLKDRGYLAFICQNSWLDTSYGIDMQRYLIRNFEIITIIDSEVERFFPSASVNTTIVILRKQKDELLREKNIVKFIYLKSTLAEIINKHKNVNRLSSLIKTTDKNINNENYSLNCIDQKAISQFTKWGQFLKAPQVYFDLLRQGFDKFVPLRQLAIIKYGIKTGNNDYFITKDLSQTAEDKLLNLIINNPNKFQTVNQILEENLLLIKNGFNELWLIEACFLFPILASSKNVNTYSLDPLQLQYKILTSDKEKKDLKSHYPYLYEYIKYGEKMNIHKGSTVASRKIWYNVNEKLPPDMSFNYMINDFGKTYLGKVFAIDNFQSLYVDKNKKSVFLYLNSTISWFLQQLIIRTNFGDGVGKIQSYEFGDMLVAAVDLEDLDINLGKTLNFKEELGSLESLITVNPERLKLDSAILKAIGYNVETERNETLLKLYKETYKLIQTRLLKAQSLKGIKANRNKVEFSVYVEQLKETLVIGKYKAKNTFLFAKQLEKLVYDITSEIKLQKKILDSYWKEKFGENFNEEKIANNDQVKLF